MKNLEYAISTISDANRMKDYIQRKKEVLFTVEYRITASSNIATIEKISAFKAKFDDSSPEAFAQAMSHAVSDFTESLSLDLKKISNK